ncbi:MAG: hypothetical protein M1132_04895 [Chloroflexi bacterium]|nr:hypothetical protein [Chloroflexota bacterium]
MDVELDHLRRHLDVDRAGFQRLRKISSSTMDRFPRTERRPMARHRGGTKPGTLLKSQIQVRTFADWGDKRPGSRKLIWCSTMAAIRAAFLPVRWM